MWAKKLEELKKQEKLATRAFLCSIFVAVVLGVFGCTVAKKLSKGEEFVKPEPYDLSDRLTFCQALIDDYLGRREKEQAKCISDFKVEKRRRDALIKKLSKAQKALLAPYPENEKDACTNMAWSKEGVYTSCMDWAMNRDVRTLYNDESWTELQQRLNRKQGEK